MTKLLIGLLGAGVIATGGYAAATSVDADPARTVSLPGATSTGDTTTSGTTTDDEPASVPAPAPATTTDDGEDISGPCDEAEHANDPRCTGGAADDDRGGDGDDSGRGSGRDDDNDDDDDSHEDRSGSNSGKG